MSNALAIATVTQALALLIERELAPDIDLAVSVQTRKPHTEPPTDPTITAFCYQVVPDAARRNANLPSRASDGELIRRPAAALDLNYLITGYGEENELVGQRLIGSVVRTLQEIPVLPPDVIAEAAQRPYLRGSDLADADHKVRFTPIQMDVDETSKLWGTLYQTPYALSVTYQATLVLIDGRRQPEELPRVREREVRMSRGSVTPAAAMVPRAVSSGAVSSGAESTGAESSAARSSSAGPSAAPSANRDGRAE